VNSERINYLLNQTVNHRKMAEESYLILDDTLCEQVGSLFEYVDRHYDHSNHHDPWAHNLVTSHYLSGAVRFPVDLRVYRLTEEVTRWSEFVKKYFPELEIPKQKKERQKLHKLVDQTLLKDPEFQELHNQFQTKIALAVELIEQARLTGTYAVLLSNRTDWSAQKILASYLQRWPIETFYHDEIGHLGLDEDRMRSAEAISLHWCLVFVAYSLLHLAGLPSSLI
jgi:hypothetical protein